LCAQICKVVETAARTGCIYTVLLLMQPVAATIATMAATIGHIDANGVYFLCPGASGCFITYVTDDPLRICW